MKKELPIKRKVSGTTISVRASTLANMRVLKAYTGIDYKDMIDKFAKDELDKRGIAHVDMPLDL